MSMFSPVLDSPSDRLSHSKTRHRSNFPELFSSEPSLSDPEGTVSDKPANYHSIKVKRQSPTEIVQSQKFACSYVIFLRLSPQLQLLQDCREEHARSLRLISSAKFCKIR